MFFNVTLDESQYILSDFVFENLCINAKENGFNEGTIKNLKQNNVKVNL